MQNGGRLPVSALRGDVEVVVETEGGTPRAVKATRAGLDEHIEEGTSVSVVAKHTAGLEVRDEHGGEEGERGGSCNFLRR